MLGGTLRCQSCVVREEGLEPSRPFGHRNLNPARLPIPPLARVVIERSYLTVTPSAPTLAAQRGASRTTFVACWSIGLGPTGYPSRNALVLRSFEDRLERLVEGMFARAFRSGLQPVELGRR